MSNLLQILRKSVGKEIQRFNKPGALLFYRSIVSTNEFEKCCEETLEELSDFFDELGDDPQMTSEYDSSYSNGVLNVKLGQAVGTYVINKQSPNKQIWLSSPISGPKRFDFVNGSWKYSHTNQYLHEILEQELTSVLSKPVQLNILKYYYRSNDT